MSTIIVTERNPQAELMADESMARNLAHQADAIWPQESPLFARYGLQGALQILDVGCGTGEITKRLASMYPHAQLLGIDILDSNLQIARRDALVDPQRMRFEVGDAYALAIADASMDLVVCRHVSQSIPDFHLVLKEFFRVLKPGGIVHLISEDYAMLHMSVLDEVRAADTANDGFDPDRFWLKHAIEFLKQTRCDGRIGRHTPEWLTRTGFEDISMDFLTVDTLRVPRETFGGIIRAWRDGYTEVLAEASNRKVDEVFNDFNRLIHVIETPPHYAVWHVPVVAGRRPK